MSLTRQVLKAICIIAALFAGCSGGTWQRPYATPAYGSPQPPHVDRPSAPYDPTLRLTDFSYTPASPLHLGETLQLSARTNHGFTGSAVHVYVKAGENEPVYPLAWLRDDGQAPDDTAGDGQWHGFLEWAPSFGLRTDALITARLWWRDHPAQVVDGPPLTVLPEDNVGL